MKEEQHTPKDGNDRQTLVLDELARLDGPDDQGSNWKYNLILASRKCFQYVQLSESDGAACSSTGEER